MHGLFAQVLGEKDLSKAGDLFSLEDEEIKGELSDILARIEEITSAKGYRSSDNDQSVVEICITRVTSAIRLVLILVRGLWDFNGEDCSLSTNAGRLGPLNSMHLP